MPVEKKGSQYRVRIKSPISFVKSSIRIKDVGRKGGLQIVIGRLKGRNKTTLQALRVSIKDFRKRGNKIIPITSRGKREAKVINQILYGTKYKK